MRRMLIVALLAALAVPAAAQMTPVTVPFDPGESRLSERARAILDAFAADYRAGRAPGAVVIAGHTGRDGSAEANVQLSDRRSALVRDYLTAAGVSRGDLTTQAFGESRPVIETADGVREPLNDRVEITVGPGSGW